MIVYVRHQYEVCLYISGIWRMLVYFRHQYDVWLYISDIGMKYDCLFKASVWNMIVYLRNQFDVCLYISGIWRMLVYFRHQIDVWLYISGIVLSCLLVIVVIAMCPFLLHSVYKLTNNIQGYALTLADKTKVRRNVCLLTRDPTEVHRWYFLGTLIISHISSS